MSVISELQTTSTSFNHQEINNIIKKTSPNLGPAMLWASWKCGEESGDVLTTLINLGGKPNHVNTFFSLPKK
jgi:hypothetical protein